MPRKLEPCGTNAAHERHLRRDERPCDACRRAHNAEVAAYLRRTGRATARQRALAKLARRHLKAFEQFYTQARRSEQARRTEPGTGDKTRRRAYQAALRALRRDLPDEFDELFQVELANVEAEADALDSDHGEAT